MSIAVQLYKLSGYEDGGVHRNPTMENPHPGEPSPWRTLTRENPNLTLENHYPAEPTLWLDVMKQLSLCNEKDTTKRLL